MPRGREQVGTVFGLVLRWLGWFELIEGCQSDGRLPRCNASPARMQCSAMQCLQRVLSACGLVPFVFHIGFEIGGLGRGQGLLVCPRGQKSRIVVVLSMVHPLPSPIVWMGRDGVRWDGVGREKTRVSLVSRSIGNLV